MQELIRLISSSRRLKLRFQHHGTLQAAQNVVRLTGHGSPRLQTAKRVAKRFDCQRNKDRDQFKKLFFREIDRNKIRGIPTRQTICQPKDATDSGLSYIGTEGRAYIRRIAGNYRDKSAGDRMALLSLLIQKNYF